MLKQSGWTGFPSGRHRFAMELMLSKSDIERRYGLAFIAGEDSLGKGHSTYFIDELLGPVSMIIYERSRHGQAYVLVDSQLRLSVAVPRLREVFGLDPSLVIEPIELD